MVWAFFFAALFFWAGFAKSAPVMEPVGSTLYILLNTVSGSPSSQGSDKCWNDDLKDYIQNKVVGRKGHVHCANYDLSGQSPAEFAAAFSKADSGIFPNALKNWYAETDAPAIVSYKNRGWNLDRLKVLRPDLLPLRFVVLSNGASGLAVREYIQSPQYEGEISNAVFFNTPHEGTGFADQALFSKKPESIGKSWDVSSMVALVPLTLSAYVVGGSSGFRDVMLSLAKDTVFGMAAGFASDSSTWVRLWRGRPANGIAPRG